MRSGHTTIPLGAHEVVASKARQREDCPLPETTVFLGNLPGDMSDQALLRLLQRHSSVQRIIVLKHLSGRNKGFGFAVLGSEEELVEAIRRLNGTWITSDGCYLSDFLSNAEDEESEVAGSSVLQVLEECSRALVELVCEEPNRLEELEWRDLERMMAAVFEGIGYATSLTRWSKDGGEGHHPKRLSPRMRCGAST